MSLEGKMSNNVSKNELGLEQRAQNADTWEH